MARKERQRRPTRQELWALSRYFSNRKRSTPMLHIMWFAIYSARRLSEITRLEWADNNANNATGMVRDAKDPRKKKGNHKRFKYPRSAWKIVQRQPETSEFIFPYNPKTIGTNFDRACNILGIVDLHMIAADIPGLYIFHRDEEIGGYGSSHIRYRQPEILAGIKFALAFDRKDTNSIITHMRFERCCSAQFAGFLSNTLGMQHRLDDTGGFTDVTQYQDLIKECSNISVGYLNEHRISEKLNYFYLRSLRTKLLKVNWQAIINELHAA